MPAKHVIFIALVVWLILSFMPQLLLPSLAGMGRGRGKNG